MRVNVISGTIQEFDGERFYLCGNYFQHKGKRLHVAVWKYHKGDIPKGYHIHHKDGDRSNNDIDNLELKQGRIHLSEHGSAPERESYNHQHIEDMRVLASRWHGSDNGRQWHSEQGMRNWEKRKERTYVCNYCGNEYRTKRIYAKNENSFCGNRCKSAYRRKSGLDDETRICQQCGREYTVNKYSKAICCSRECAVRRRWGK